MTSTSQRAFTEQLREVLLAEAERRRWDPERLAHEAGFLPAGMKTLIERKRWDLDSALRVADALGVEVRPVLDRRDGSDVKPN